MAAVLRSTKNFYAVRSPRGVKIVCKVPGVTPKSRVVRLVQDWENYLEGLSDREFEGACVMDFGIAVFQR